MDIHKVILARGAIRDLHKLPSHIALKLQAWVEDVSHRGLNEVRKVSGYHDEPLQGKRKGQRSIRLSKAYRAIYEIDKTGAVHFVEIVEINKHEY